MPSLDRSGGPSGKELQLLKEKRVTLFRPLRAAYSAISLPSTSVRMTAFEAITLFGSKARVASVRDAEVVDSMLNTLNNDHHEHALGGSIGRR